MLRCSNFLKVTKKRVIFVQKRGAVFPPIRSLVSTHWKHCFQTLEAGLPLVGKKVCVVCLRFTRSFVVFDEGSGYKVN